MPSTVWLELIYCQEHPGTHSIVARMGTRAGLDAVEKGRILPLAGNMFSVSYFID
jgi:hypothetical protein